MQNYNICQFIIKVHTVYAILKKKFWTRTNHMHAHAPNRKLQFQAVIKRIHLHACAHTCACVRPVHTQKYIGLHAQYARTPS